VQIKRVQIIDLIYIIPGFLLVIYLTFGIRFYPAFIYAITEEQISVSFILLSIGLSIGVVIMWIRNSYRISFTIVDLLVIVYILYLIFIADRYHQIGFIQEVTVIALGYLYFRNFKLTYISRLLYLIPLGAIYQIIYGYRHLTELWQGLADIHGVFTNTGIFGHFIAVSFVITMGLIYSVYKKKKWLSVILLSFVLLILGIQLYYIQSRASWLGAGVGIGIFPIYYLFKNYIITIKKIFSSKKIFFFLFILMSVLFLLFSFDRVYRMKKDSADGRILIYKVSLALLDDDIIIGKGINGFKDNYMDAQAQYFETRSDSPYIMLADENIYAFNEYLRIIIEQGIVGLILFVGLFLVVIYGRSKFNIYSILKASLISLLVISLFSYPFEIFQLSFISILFIALLSHASKKKFSIKNFSHVNSAKIALSIGVLLIVLIGSLHIQSYCKTVMEWDQAQTMFRTNQMESLFLYEQLYFELNNTPEFLISYGMNLSIYGDIKRSKNILEEANKRRPTYYTNIELGNLYKQEEKTQKALFHWKKAANMIPSRLTPGYLSAKLYYELGDYDKSKQEAINVLNKKIKVSSPEINRIISELKKIEKFR